MNRFHVFVRLLLLKADSVCYSCDSKNSPNECFGLTDNSIVSTCQTSFDKCYTVIVDDVLYRGCVGDAQFPNEESIEKCSNPSLCQICSDTNQCNSNLITDVCLKCGGTGSNSSSTCDKQETDKYLIVPCSLKNDEQSNRCFFKVTNDTFAKGCMRHLSSIEQKQCQQQSKACYSCSSPNCNQNINVCYECNGENNLNCTDKIDTENNTTRIICSDESMACVTGIDANGFTHRGCFSIDGLGSTFPFGFTNCSTSLCNNRIFPSNRLTCYQCEGDIECKTLENLRPAICNNFVDQCYTYLDGGM